MWVAYHLFLGNLPMEEVVPGPLRQDLLAELHSGGVSLSPSFPVPDADDTAVALLLLAEAGVAVDPVVLQQFERDDYFVSFPFERHPSTGVNIHVLDALARFDDYPGRERAITKIVRFLEQARYLGGYWIDKWHISPYYATSHAIVALAALRDRGELENMDLIDAAVGWIVRTQNEDGSWGWCGMPTTEETAYAVLALCRTRSGPLSSGVTEAIESGLAYLRAHRNAPRPALWIDKCLYYPTRIVDAVIQAALS